MARIFCLVEKKKLSHSKVNAYSLIPYAFCVVCRVRIYAPAAVDLHIFLFNFSPARSSARGSTNDRPR